MKNIPLKWNVGFSPSESKTPEEFIHATVPGAVQLDWARAHDWPDVHFADNFRAYEWMEDVFWRYTANLPALPEGRIFFVSKGIDYQFRIFLDGMPLHEQEGMFSSVELEITTRVREGSRVDVLVFPAPKRHRDAADRSQADHCCKPAVSYGWDWHPRLIPLGIWDETFVQVRPPAFLRDAEVTFDLSPDRRSATLHCRASADGMDSPRFSWTIFDPSGGEAGRGESDAVWDLSLSDPVLWWPAGHGTAALYEAHVRLVDHCGMELDCRILTFGIRRARLVMHEGAWDHPSSLPKTRSTPPVTVEINGRRIFARGTNWVNPDIFPGRVTEQTLKPLLDLVEESHFNMLRCWGGAPANKEVFYAECDRRGLLVWQEFPLACNNYDNGGPGYLKVLDQESRALLLRLRRHPCVILWCGGNELFNAWSGMTDQSPALRLLNANCLELAPHEPFLPTAPLDGMGHGDYRFRDEQGREVYQIYAGAGKTAYSEFGCPSCPDPDVLREFLPEQELFPPRPGSAWESHHAFGAWDGEPGSWLCLHTIEHYFGPTPDLETLCARSQWLQAEGLRFVYEEARRQSPRCSMALNWCFNEAWPAAANCSMVAWPARPKPALKLVAAACRPSLASATISKFSWRPGEVFMTKLWLLNDSPHPLPPGSLLASLEFSDGSRVFSGQWYFPEIELGKNAAGPVVELAIPDDAPAGAFVIHVECPQSPNWNSQYRLFLTNSATG